MFTCRSFLLNIFVCYIICRSAALYQWRRPVHAANDSPRY